MYTYKASLLRVVDGDTCDLDIDLGLYVHKHERIRIAHIDTPEREELREALESQLPYRTLADSTVVVLAARSWLALSEGDEAMVEKGVKAINEAQSEWLPESRIPSADRIIFARAVIAAITEGRP